MYWKGMGNATFTRPFPLLDMVTFDEHVSAWKGLVKVTSQTHLLNLNDSLSKT